MFAWQAKVMRSNSSSIRERKARPMEKVDISTENERKTYVRTGAEVQGLVRDGAVKNRVLNQT